MMVLVTMPSLMSAGMASRRWPLLALLAAVALLMQVLDLMTSLHMIAVHGIQAEPAAGGRARR